MWLNFDLVFYIIFKVINYVLVILVIRLNYFLICLIILYIIGYLDMCELDCL